jgi:hypothetical protein
MVAALAVGVLTTAGADSSVQTFAAVQAYRLEPAGAPLLKKSWPSWQVEGNADPTESGRVNGNVEKSGFRLCVCKFKVVGFEEGVVWANA